MLHIPSTLKDTNDSRIGLNGVRRRMGSDVQFADMEFTSSLARTTTASYQRSTSIDICHSGLVTFQMTALSNTYTKIGIRRLVCFFPER